ncbi:MAG: hypothetical protein QOJ65_2492, partial [Fimbriimonadaceae bacterium]|nr:hypothetical protein [Fimbriimonadaceae bacterium]
MLCFLARVRARIAESAFFQLQSTKRTAVCVALAGLALTPVLAPAQSLQLWTAYRDLGSPTDRAVGSRTDPSGNTYVLGEVTKSSGAEVVLCKISTTGSIGWTRTIANTGADRAEALTLMPSGGAGIAYSLYNSAAGSLLGYIRRYDSSSNAVYTYGPIAGGFRATAMTAGSDGSLFVAGTSGGYARSIRINSTGGLVWDVSIPGLVEGGTDVPSGIVTDLSGGAYLSGEFWNGAFRAPGIFRIDSSGGIAWGQFIDVLGGASGSATAMMIDGSGFVYVSGYSDFSGTNHGWVGAYNSAGAQTWIQTSAASGYFGESFNTITMDPWSRVVVAGSAFTSPGNQDFFVNRYSNTGIFIWSAIYDGPGAGSDVARWVQPDQWGSLLVAGSVQEASGKTAYGVVKLAPTGVRIWPTSGDVIYNGGAIYPAGPNPDNLPSGFGVDSRGNAYMAGSSVGPSSAYDINVVKYGLTDNAGFVDQAAPTSMMAGMPYDVRLTFQNTGNTVWSKAEGYKIGSQNPVDNKTWGFNRVEMVFSDSISKDQNATLSFKVTAPLNSGTFNFQWRMRSSLSFFGDTSVNVPITVTLLPDSNRYISQTVPTSVKVGSNFTVTIKMRNVGSNTWTNPDYSLVPVTGTGYSTWGVSSVPLGSAESIVKGQDKTFTFICKAPSTTGNFKMKW